MSGHLVVPLVEADAEEHFGGKAVQLAHALKNGLPVPGGVAVAWSTVSRFIEGDQIAYEVCAKAFADLDGHALAVRSSAVGEDSAAASFAGQHITRLGIRSVETGLDALRAVWMSGQHPGALAYRERMGIAGAPRVGVVIQIMVDSECAGVLFTRDPITGADHRVIEAAWGLGESVVSGLVDPDRYRVRRGGEVLEAIAGDKHVAIRHTADGQTEECPTDAAEREALCLVDDRLRALDELASSCERVFGGESAHDLEWAFDRERLYLLQRRAVTRGGTVY